MRPQRAPPLPHDQLGEREPLNLGILGPGLGVRGLELILLRSASREDKGEQVGEPMYCSPPPLYCSSPFYWHGVPAFTCQ